MTTNELNEILSNHAHWVKKDIDGWENLRANLDGERLVFANLQLADLRNASLRNADLYDANLRSVNLSHADLYNVNLRDSYLKEADLYKAHLRAANLINAILRGADLRSTTLCHAYLRNADLKYADLEGADLRYANFRCANLNRVNLSNADLQGADLTGADLSNANLEGTNLHNTLLSGANLNCIWGEPKGELIDFRNGKILTSPLIGFKKCKDNAIVTLEIPRGSIVFAINGKECRTNKARVIAIDGGDRAFSIYNHMSYYVGDEITIYDFNCEYNVECGEGIHFFLNREDGEKYLY